MSVTPTAPQLTFKLPALDPRVVDALHEIVAKSLDRFTGRVVLDVQGGVILSVETRTKRKLTRAND